MKKLLLALVVVFCSFLMFACDKDVDEEIKYDLKVNKDAYELTVGDSVNLDVTFTKDAPISWTSSDPKVVTVLDGVATAAKEGTAKITVSIKNTELSFEITITVVAKEILPESVTITGGNTVEEGGTLDFVAAVLPEGASQEVVWSTSDQEVATIDAAGKLTAVKAGTVKVIATAKDTEVKGEFDVTVTAPAIEYDYSKLLVGPAFEGEEVEENGVTYYVGETAFTSVNEALAKALEGAEIYVLAGTYAITELITVDKPVTILGPNADKGVADERNEEAIFTSDNYNTGSFLVSGAGITLNGLGFKGIGEQGYPIQTGTELENFAIKSCYFENVNTLVCPFDKTTYKGTFTITNTVNNNSLQFLAWIDGTAAELTKFEYTNNKVYGEVPSHFAGKGMISFRATDSEAEVVIENNEFDLTNYVLSSNPIFVASGTLTVKNNVFKGVKEADLFVEGTVENKTLEGNECDQEELPTEFDYSKLLLAPTLEATVVEVDGVKYYAGETAFTNIADALAKVTGATEIYVLAGTYANEMTIDKNDITLVGPNKDVNAKDATRAEEAVISNKITLADGVQNFTINGFKLSGSGQLLLGADCANIAFKYNVMDATTADGIVRCPASGVVTNLEVSYCYSNNYKGARVVHVNDALVGFTAIYNYIENDTTGFASNSGCFDFMNVAGYLAGEINVKDNTFINSLQSFFYVKGVKALNAVFEGNYFEGIANTVLDFRDMKEANAAVTFEIKGNTFKNAGCGWCPIRIRTAAYAEGNTISVNVNYNKFIDSYYNDASGPQFLENPSFGSQVDPFKVIYNCDYNYYEVNGAAITELTADNFCGAASSWENTFANADDVVIPE